MAAAALVAVAAPACASPSPTLADALAGAATHACFDVLSGKTAWPTDGPDQLAAEEKLLAGWGLKPGIDDGAMAKMKAAGSTMLGQLNQSTLATGIASDGRFIMALGGARSTCRLFVYGAGNVAATKSALLPVLARPDLGWKEAPGTSLPAMEKHMFIKRSGAGTPFLLNVLIPAKPTGSIELAMTVVAVPAGVALPQGY